MIEDMKLPPALVYLTACLGGRVLMTFLWLIIVFPMFFLAGYWDDLLSGRFSSTMIACGLYTCFNDVLFSASIIAAVRRESGRKWLLRRIECAKTDAPRSSIKLLVRAIPFVALVPFLERLIFSWF